MAAEEKMEGWRACVHLGVCVFLYVCIVGVHEAMRNALSKACDQKDIYSLYLQLSF